MQENKIDNEFEDEMYEHYNFQIPKGQQIVRLDKFLFNSVENITRNKIQKAIESGNVLVNNQIVKSNYKVKPFDEIKYFFVHPTYEEMLKPEPIPLNIVYEDDQVLVLNKPAGLVVHPGSGNFSGTLVNGLVYHFENLPNNSSDRPGLVHRIDKDTTGLLVVAKTEFAMNHLTKQFAEKTTEREYIAIVWGNIEEDEGTIIGNIARHQTNRMQMTVYPDGETGKPAVTHFKVLERFGYVTVVSCKLETGRTHQIRVHMKYVGHTLFNDERYGGDEILKGTTFTKYKQFVDNCFKVLPRQALHAKTLGFQHPTTGEFLRFDTEVPTDMVLCIEKWRTYSKSNQSEQE